MSKINYEPKSSLIEKTASALATEFYEIGRSQGLTSKYKNHRAYARANLEKFIPKAIEYLITMLGNPSFPELAKAEIYEALMERHNDPKFKTDEENKLPDLDVKKLMASMDEYNKNKIIINTKPIDDRYKKFMPKAN